MDCPYCHHSLAEATAVCPSCGFHGEALRQWLGEIPRLHAGLNDLAGVLDTRQADRIESARRHFQQRFPQCDFHFVLGSFDPKVPLPVMAFALFNFGKVSSPNRQGGLNRDLLLLTDIEALRSHLAVGYGLEPFVPPVRLAEVLGAAGPALRSRDAATAAEMVLEKWTAVLTQLLDGLRRQFGLPRSNEIAVPLDLPLVNVRQRRRNPY